MRRPTSCTAAAAAAGCLPSNASSTRRAWRTASTTRRRRKRWSRSGRRGCWRRLNYKCTFYLTTVSNASRSAALRGHRNVVTRAAFLSPPVSAIFARSSGSSAASATAEAPSALDARSPSGASAPPGRRKSPNAHAPKGMELHANTGRPAVPVAAVAVCLTKSSGYRTSAANLCANRAARRWREGHDLCTAVDVPLTAPSTAGAGAASNASSENPASRRWRSVQPQKPNINAQSAQNMSAQWQQCQMQQSGISGGWRLGTFHSQ